MNQLLNQRNLLLLGEFCDFSVFNEKNVLITGGTGMVGSFLAESIILGCKIQGYQPTKLRIGGESISRSEKEKFSNVGYVEMSSDYLMHSKILQTKNKTWSGDNQIIFHLASPASVTKIESYESLKFVNVDCLENILNPNVEKLMYFSTGEVYGNKAGQLLREPEHANFNLSIKRDWYPQAKLEGEEKSKELCSLHDIKLSVIRLFHTFGPGVKRSDGRSFADFLYAAAAGHLPILKSKGQDVRTFLFSVDAVIAFINICNQSDKFNTYNVGSNAPVTILKFAQEISEVAGLNGKVDFNLSSNNEYIHSPNQSLVPDITKITNLGWRNRTDIRTAISETLQYIKAN